MLGGGGFLPDGRYDPLTRVAEQVVHTLWRTPLTKGIDRCQSLVSVARVGQELERWDVVERVAEAVWLEGRRESGERFFDLWPARAFLAGGRLARGDEEERKLLLDRAGRHPEALSVLCRIEKMLGHRRAESDLRALREMAPGAARMIEEGGRL